MKMRVRFRPEAEAEAITATEWYEEQEMGLGSRFREEIERKIEAIERIPLSFPRIENSQFHKAFLNKFPFVIIFAIEEGSIIIASVFHTSRDPVTINERIG